MTIDQAPLFYQGYTILQLQTNDWTVNKCPFNITLSFKKKKKTLKAVLC